MAPKARERNSTGENSFQANNYVDCAFQSLQTFLGAQSETDDYSSIQEKKPNSWWRHQLLMN